jgi:hypothetical protein
LEGSLSLDEDDGVDKVDEDDDDSDGLSCDVDDDLMSDVFVFLSVDGGESTVSIDDESEDEVIEV